MDNNEMQHVQARFDRVAAEWDANPARVTLARAVTDAIRQAVPLHSGMNVMDFGAGTGLVTLALLPHTAHITAVDASSEMLRVLTAKLTALQIGNVQTLQLDCAQTPLPTAKFDLIVSSMVLHHIPDVPKTLHQLHAALRTGGWIALADLDSEDGTFHPDSAGVYHNGFDRNEVCQWLRDAGFADVTVREAHRMIRLSADGTNREYPVFLVTGRAA